MRGALACVMALLCAGTSAAAVSAPVVDKAPRARGMVVLVHGGGWAGPDPVKQERLAEWPGAVFRAAGWSTRSIDYAAGKAGLADVVRELAHTLARQRRVCVYGESAGGHFALLAAAQLPRLQCVMTLGAPTDFDAWRWDAVTEQRAWSAQAYLQTAALTFFGPDEAAWEPASLARRVTARVLLAAQADDLVLPMPGQLRAFRLARPTTRTLYTPAGNFDDPAHRYLHGTLPPAARALLGARLAAFLR